MRARLLLLLALLACCLLFVPGIARGDGSDHTTARVPYTVQPGDTLWSIARRVAPADDPRAVVDRLVRDNRLPGGAVQAGQELWIPAPSSTR